jgi:hypothetical protein
MHYKGQGRLVCGQWCNAIVRRALRAKDVADRFRTVLHSISGSEEAVASRDLGGGVDLRETRPEAKDVFSKCSPLGSNGIAKSAHRCHVLRRGRTSPYHW